MRSCLRRISVAALALAAFVQPWAEGAVAQQRSDQAARGVVVAPSGFERVGSGPSSLFWIRDGLTGIVDSLASSVAFVDDAGRVVGRAALPAGFIVSGTDANDTRILLLSGDRKSVVELPRSLDPASPPQLNPQPLPPSGRSAPGETVRRSRTQMAVPSVAGTARSAPAQLEVRSLTGSSLADAAEIGADKEGRRYVQWSELVSTNPSIVVRAFVGRYGADGRLTGVAELPIAEMDYIPDAYVAITGGGDVQVMVPTQTRMEIRTIPVQAVPAVNPRTTTNIISPGNLRRLQSEKGSAVAVETVVKGQQDAPAPRNLAPPAKQEREGRALEPITRAKVLELGREFISVQWTLAEGNYEQSGLPDACDKAEGQYWSRPSWVRKDLIGQTMTRIPYRWGGFDNPTVYVKRLGEGAVAGDVCICRDSSHNDCIVPRAAGVDCSGFISRAWGLVRKYGTSTLAEVSTLVKNWQTNLGALKPGDALNRAGSHVRLVVEAVTEPQVRIVVIESTNAPTCRQRDGTVAQCEGVCECARPIAEFNRYQLIRFKGIRDE
jgi:cell wall-associated NlpC family hydrolase